MWKTQRHTALSAMPTEHCRYPCSTKGCLAPEYDLVCTTLQLSYTIAVVVPRHETTQPFSIHSAMYSYGNRWPMQQWGVMHYWLKGWFRQSSPGGKGFPHIKYDATYPCHIKITVNFGENAPYCFHVTNAKDLLGLPWSPNKRSQSHPKGNPSKIQGTNQTFSSRSNIRIKQCKMKI